MINLSIGDRIRVKRTKEAGIILKVINESNALVDFFHGPQEVSNEEIEPFRANSEAKKGDGAKPVQFVYRAPKKIVNAAISSNIKWVIEEFIDLHAHKIMDDPHNHSNEVILSIQKSKLKSYIEEAVENNLKRVYIIHGIGSGRLKSEVHEILRKDDRIHSFKDDDSGNYGAGATVAELY